MLPLHDAVDDGIFELEVGEHRVVDRRVVNIRDDGNVLIHFDNAETLSNIIQQNHPQFNVEKIYFDAYKQVSNSGGQRYPDVEIAINERLNVNDLYWTWRGSWLGTRKSTKDFRYYFLAK